MPSNQHRGGKGNGEVGGAQPKQAKSGETSRDGREQVAATLEDAATKVGEAKETLPTPLDDHAEDVESGLDQAADYVREHSPAEMTDDLWRIAREHPIPALLVASGLAIGGAFLLSEAMRRQGPTMTGSDERQTLSALSPRALGPHTNQALLRIRDAVVSLAVAKVVDTMEGRFPGFREHFDKVGQ